MVRAFAHGAMGCRIDPSWGGPIELFLFLYGCDVGLPLNLKETSGKLCKFSFCMAGVWPTTKSEGRKEMFFFNDALNTFYLQLYGVRHMVKDHSDTERGNPLYGICMAGCGRPRTLKETFHILFMLPVWLGVADHEI